MIEGSIIRIIKKFNMLMNLASPSKTLSVYMFGLNPYGVENYFFGDPKNPKFKILIDGDSTAAGYGATNYSNTITNLVGERLVKNKLRIEILNISKAGAQVTNLYKKLIPIENSAYDLGIIIGSNDLFALKNPEISSRSLREVIEKYLVFCRRVIVMGPGRGDILSGINNDKKLIYREKGIEMAHYFKQIIDNFSRVYYCDPQNLFDPIEKYGNIESYQADDGFHPNDKGYKIYAMDLLEYGFRYFKL